MAISTAFCTSHKSELLGGLSDYGNAGASPIGGDAFKLALFKASVAGTFGAASTNYSEMSTDEATDTASPQGYSAGGGALTNVGRSVDGTTAIVNFADITFTAVNLSSDGCMIYNTTNGNAASSVHSFGSTKTATGGDFVVQFPAAAAATAIIRLA